MVCQGKIRGVELFMILVRVLVESLGNVSLDLCLTLSAARDP